jgi:FtsP/CotA-like multicopper oxidase with cupredoxin domain
MQDVMNRHEVIVVGGGQAGLAMGHFLLGRGRDFVILEAADQPAAAWRRRWDSLRLFTPARYSALPGLSFPGEPDRYPTRDHVMKLLPAQLVSEAAAGHEHEHEHAHQHGGDEDAGGIEWEDDMVEVNRLTTPANMRWKLIDRETGAENAAIDWRFRVGDQVKIRLLNEMAGDHPMHHPFHIHGAGRFLVLSRDGAVEPNLVWKDTVLVRTGETVDILLDVTNPGRWMAHCHIAEHHESGMMFSFDVEE